MFLAAFIMFIALPVSAFVKSSSRLSTISSKYLTKSKRIFSSFNENEVSYKTTFLFPGQGAQFVGMASELCKLPEAKALFDEASSILGYDLLYKCNQGTKEELDSTAVAQPAIFVTSMAALKQLQLQNPNIMAECGACMGLSLGEYSALCAAGCVSFSDGVRLTAARGEAMQRAARASDSGMLAVLGLSEAQAQALCDEAAAASGAPICIANYLMRGNLALSGARLACEAAQSLAQKHGARMCVRLSVAGAFHSAFMAPAAEALREALAQAQISRARLPVLANVDARAHGSPDAIRASLLAQLTSPVRWDLAMDRLSAFADSHASENCSAYELGPGTVCKGILKRVNKKINVVNVP